jgi:hypothetical protein
MVQRFKACNEHEPQLKKKGTKRCEYKTSLCIGTLASPAKDSETNVTNGMLGRAKTKGAGPEGVLLLHAFMCVLCHI